MTNEEMNIAVAEYRGWTIEDTGSGKCWHLNGICSEEAPPNYPEDLNAMHEAFTSLPEADRPTFAVHLYHIVCGTSQKHDDHFIDWFICAEIANATAAQRREAFLSTFGKWKETP